MSITTLEEFIDNYCVVDGMPANADNVNKSPIQLKKEVNEVNNKLTSTQNSSQVLDPTDAITINGKVISLKKGDGSIESISLDLFDSKISRVSSVDNRLVRYSGTNGDIKLSSATLDDSGNLIITGSITSNTGVINGNSSTATKLATARTIGGVSFDGTSNINLPGVNIVGNQNTSGNAATATSAQNPYFFTNGNSTENQIGVKLTGYNDVYLYSNATSWGVYSESGGSAF